MRKTAQTILRKADMGRAGEIWDFLKTRKKWWLTPIIIVLILLSVVLVLSQGSAVAPFIYAIF